MHILLVDDHGILRAGVRSLIQQVHHQAVVLEAACSDEAADLVRQQAFDVIFLDLCIPKTRYSEDLNVANGLGLLALFKGARSEPADPDPAQRVAAPVIVMSAEPGRQFVDEVMRRGATSFVPKSASHEVMLEAIHRALHGGIFLPSPAIGRGGAIPEPDVGKLGQGAGVPLSHKDLGITAREFDVLRLALQGNAPWKIAAILEINAVNVRQYLSRLYARFGVIDLYGLQGLFAKTGQVVGVLLSSNAPSLATRPAPTSA